MIFLLLSEILTPQNLEMETTKILQLLNNLSTLLEIKGENSFKAGAYSTAADIIETQGLDLGSLVKQNKLGEINGFGKALVAKLTDLVENGRMKYYDELTKEIPESLLTLTKLEGLGSKKVGRLFRELDVTDLDSLRRACEKGEIAELKGFGKKTQDKILEQLNE